MLVYRTIDVFTTVTNASIPQAIHDNHHEHGTTNWMSESLPFLIMVTMTWASFRCRILYSSHVGRINPRDFQRLFCVENNRRSYHSKPSLSIQSKEQCTEATSSHDGCCPICLENYHDGNQNKKHQRIVRTKHCGHAFHEECILEWCNHQAISRTSASQEERILFLSCPCCRSNLNIREDDKMDARSSNADRTTTGTFSIQTMLRRMPQWGNGDNPLRWQPSSTTTRRRYYEQMTGAALGMSILAEATVLVVRWRGGEKLCPQ